MSTDDLKILSDPEWLIDVSLNDDTYIALGHELAHGIFVIVGNSLSLQHSLIVMNVEDRIDQIMVDAVSANACIC
jgi:hypothetical protein